MSMKSTCKLTALFAACTILLLLPGCADHLESVNKPEDRLVADDIDESKLGQSYAQAQWAGYTLGGPFNFEISEELFSDPYAQYFSINTSYYDSPQYVEISDWSDGAWSAFYSIPAPPLNFVREITAEEGLDVRHAVANITKVLIYHRKTDWWGPIPYSEFGNDELSVPYDSQESIYMDFFDKLDNAVSVLQQNPNGNAFGSHDQIYEGDVESWITLANSLRLRLAMRIRYVEPEIARQEAEKAVNAGVMQDNSDNAMILSTPNSRNPYTTVTDWNNFRMSSAMESLLEGYSDPRTDTYFNPAVNGDRDGDGSAFEGMRNGLPRTQKAKPNQDRYSQMGTRWFNSNRGGSNPPMPVMRAAEVYFLRAEGALVGWDMGGSAEELYNEGIRMSMKEERIGASDQEINEYISNNDSPVSPKDDPDIYDWNTPPISDIPVGFQSNASIETRLEQIITQKWLAVYPDSYEAWAELRRTGYPKTYPIIESRNEHLNEDEIFRRMKFVVGEIENNTQAVEEARGMLKGPDQNDTRLWWDAK